MRLVEGFDGAFGEVATTGVLDGAVWERGLPYITPADQTLLINEIERMTLSSQNLRPLSGSCPAVWHFSRILRPLYENAIA